MTSKPFKVRSTPTLTCAPEVASCQALRHAVKQRKLLVVFSVSIMQCMVRMVRIACMACMLCMKCIVWMLKVPAKYYEMAQTHRMCG